MNGKKSPTSWGKSPALLATAEKRRLEMDPASGSELESLAKEVMAATPDVVQRMEKLLSGK